jgi:hypothetical protein
MILLFMFATQSDHIVKVRVPLTYGLRTPVRIARFSPASIPVAAKRIAVATMGKPLQSALESDGLQRVASRVALYDLM